MPAQPTRTERIEARTTPEVLEAIRFAAELQGRSLSDFVVQAALAAAHEAIEKDRVIRLTIEDQKRFAEALLNPGEPTPAMQRAVEHHHRLIRNR
jgi:uncharacterized protein (DUF1778 family)